MMLQKRLERLEELAERTTGTDPILPGYDFKRLNMMELYYLGYLWKKRDDAVLTQEEQKEEAQLLALVRGELNRGDFPCRGEFGILDYQKHIYGFMPCRDCGRTHPAPERLAEVPPAATWLHLLPSGYQTEKAIYKMEFYVRPSGEVIPYLEY